PTHTSLVHITFLRRRPPTTSTLFPYTTLFRSVKLVTNDEVSVRRFVVRESLSTPFEIDLVIRKPRPLLRLPDIVGKDASFTIAKDRKSTRLNSSHVKISYAVFCLKKKIQKIPE